MEIADVDALDGDIFDRYVFRAVDDGEVHATVKNEGGTVAIDGQTVEILDNESSALVAVVTVVGNAENGMLAVFFINMVFTERDVNKIVARFACGFECKREGMSDRAERGVDEFHSCLRKLEKLNNIVTHFAREIKDIRHIFHSPSDTKSTRRFRGYSGRFREESYSKVHLHKVKSM